MNIIVCVKSVRSQLINPAAAQGDSFALNPYDQYALEHVLGLKDTNKEKIDCNVTCISMGGKAAEDSLVKCYAMGADQVYWIRDPAFAGSDTVATSYILEQALAKSGDYGLVVCGERAVDGETGQIPAGLAQRLNLPYIGGVKEIVEIKQDQVVLKTTDDNYEYVVKAALPAVISFSEFTTQAQNVSLIALKRARRKPLDKLTSKDLNIDTSLCGINGSKTKVMDMKSSYEKRDSRKIEGNPLEKADMIREIVLGKAV